METIKPIAAPAIKTGGISSVSAPAPTSIRTAQTTTTTRNNVGFGQHILNSINNGMAQVKLPTVQTENEVKLSPTTMLFGGVILLLILFKNR